ncbi:EI24 domain-containing protein [Propionivibrio soli]|uniref:EI24 domain-containing protein n=1 Tax=Propionivibrio soli TaxID=2976531 RepID=UPI0021E75B1A|nr:EI24 domain-containing protein [Propionivibrio soli]
MTEMIRAVQRSLASLRQGKVWLYILGPALAALILLFVLGLATLDYLVSRFIEQPPMSWMAGWGAVWLAKVLALLGGWLVLLSASYLVAMLLTAIVVLPLMLNHVAARDYPDLVRQGRDSFVASTWNSVWAAVLFVIGWVATMPFWLVPGLGLLLPLFWISWLNRRTYAYDALAVHATADEWRRLRREHALPMLGLGLAMAALSHVPLIGLLAPSLAALAYIHYGLEALRRLRQGSVVAVANS